ncbi:hypothetical protein G7Y89_g9012 [Cudoniella acicularis]|uniref:Uncharacterized protein n=1 Tax=Cudoniella acicularis TaxID=354080 RepID=A0A8H4RI47_9HELO|nr:hypothetical protein G7Y89_g9012 [Cudoniella acicularis]
MLRKRMLLKCPNSNALIKRSLLGERMFFLPDTIFKLAIMLREGVLLVFSHANEAAYLEHPLPRVIVKYTHFVQYFQAMLRQGMFVKLAFSNIISEQLKYALHNLDNVREFIEYKTVLWKGVFFKLSNAIFKHKALLWQRMLLKLSFSNTILNKQFKHALHNIEHKTLLWKRVLFKLTNSLLELSFPNTIYK